MCSLTIMIVASLLAEYQTGVFHGLVKKYYTMGTHEQFMDKLLL